MRDVSVSRTSTTSAPHGERGAPSKARTLLSIALIALNQFGPVTTWFSTTEGAEIAASSSHASQGSPGTSGDYRIGEEDELAISVYGDPDLLKTQTVRPGGRISFPLVGDISASGLTVYELRQQLVDRIARFRREPQVTVIVTKYDSRKVSVLGQVKTPRLLHLSSDIKLLDAISRAGGLTEDADLQGAFLVRNGQIQPLDFEKLFRQGDFSQNVPLVLIPNAKDKTVSVVGQVNKPQVIPLTVGMTLMESISRAGGLTEDADLQGALLVRSGQIQPVDFEKLLRQGDFSQNVTLQPNDVVLIPNAKYKKVFVLGEVAKPNAVAGKSGLTLMEAIATAGGFTVGAKRQNILIARGGLANPHIVTVNADAITRHAAENVPLQPGDIVYVPKSVVANVVRFFQTLSTILTPFVLASTGIVLGPQVQAVLTGSGSSMAVPVNTSPTVLGR
jgi:protein involved in polysaccharide export with SLBB domain